MSRTLESPETNQSLIRVFPKEFSIPVWLHQSSIGVVHSNEFTLVTCSGEFGVKSAIVFRGRVTEVRADDFVQTPKERRLSRQDKILERIYRTYVFLGYGLLVALMTFSVLSFSGVIKARVVLTESMTPIISPGDVVVTTPVTRKEPVLGDVVTYVAKRFDGSPVGTFTHRIVGGSKESGFIVKGDNNPAPDVQRPKYEDIAGVLIFTIPFIGSLMTPKALALLVPTLFGVWLVVDALRKND